MNRWLSMLYAVVVKEARQTVRDRRMMFMLLAGPAIQLVAFGYAVNLEVDRVPTVVVNLDEGRESRTHLRRVLADGTLTQVATEASAEVASRYLEDGRAAVALVFDDGYERDAVRGETAKVQVLIDGSDPNRANVASAAVSRYFSERSEEGQRAAHLGSVQAGSAALRPSAVSVHARMRFNPELNTAIYMVPGVAAMLLLMVTTVVTAMGLSRERERGTLEQVMVTPVPPTVLIAGKIFPFAAVGLFDFGLAMAVGAFVFGMPLGGQGAWLVPMALLFLATVLYLLTTLGIGLLIAAISQSQQQAFIGGFLFMLPAALLSGIMTPVRSMPDWMQPVTLVNPLRHYAEVLRGTLLRGAGPAELGTQLLALSVIGILVFGFATWRFRKIVG